MDFDIRKASEKISSLDLKYSMEGFDINVFWLRSMEVKDEWYISRHKHSTFEFHFVKSGMSEVILDDSKFIVKEGQFYITKPKLYHSQKNIENKKYLEYCLNCSIELNKESTSENKLILDILKDSDCMAYDDKMSLISSFENNLKSIYFNNPGYFLEIKYSIPMMIICSSQIIGSGIKANYEVPYKNQSNYKFNEIKRYIEDNIDRNITLDELKDIIFLSPRQISRIVKKETNLSTKQFISKKKLEKAKEYLKNSNLSIKEISDKLGFSSVYYFTQFFKREEGYPPGVFRSNLNF